MTKTRTETKEQKLHNKAMAFELLTQLVDDGNNLVIYRTPTGYQIKSLDTDESICLAGPTLADAVFSGFERGEE
jgi:hypothetical protein